MAGLGFLLGGAVKGYGDSRLEQAKAKREAALEQLRWDRQMQAAGEQRAFTKGENDLDRAERRSDREEDQTRRDRNDQRSRYDAYVRSIMDNDPTKSISDARAEADKFFAEEKKFENLPTPKTREEALELGPGAAWKTQNGEIRYNPVEPPSSAAPASEQPVSTTDAAPEKTKAGELAEESTSSSGGGDFMERIGANLAENGNPGTALRKGFGFGSEPSRAAPDNSPPLDPSNPPPDFQAGIAKPGSKMHSAAWRRQVEADMAARPWAYKGGPR